MPADIACRHCPQVLPTVCSLKVKLSSLALLKNFLVLLNHCIIYQVRFICKSRNFLVLLNSRYYFISYTSAKAEIFLCYSTMESQMVNGKSAKAEIFLCYSTSYSLPSSYYLQKQKFSCVTQQVMKEHYGTLYLQKQKFSCVTQRRRHGIQ